MLCNFGADQGQNLEDCFVDIDPILPGRRLFHERPNPSDDLAGPYTAFQDEAKRLPNLLPIWRLGPKPGQRGIGIGYRSPDWLIDLVGDRSRELPHHCNTVRMRELHLCFAVAPFALACLRFRALALAQVQHESNTLAVFVAECSPAGQHRDVAAVLAEEFLLEGMADT